MARPICLRLLAQLIRLAASRTFWTAGRRRPIRTPMMAMTTSSSISVKACLALPQDSAEDISIDLPPRNRGKAKGVRLVKHVLVEPVPHLAPMLGVSLVGATGAG